MRTVERLDALLDAARQHGYEVRYEYLGGTGGGRCEFKGRKWLFIDLAWNAIETLEMVEATMDKDPAFAISQAIQKNAA
ncbi:hypothetical protein N9242_03155 [Vicingaceae bacterium]|nr:hypothetical protein [Vicingaceae bacterium]